MKWEGLENEKFKVLTSDMLRTVRGGTIMTSARDGGGTFSVTHNGSTYTDVVKDETHRDIKGNVTKVRIQCKDGIWVELQ